MKNKCLVYFHTSFILLLFSYTVNAQVYHDKTEISLWKGTPPDGPGTSGPENISTKGSYTNVSQPRLIVHQPKNRNGMAMLVISGGGYAHIEEGNESGPASDWLASQGITAFELIYRLPGEGWASRDVAFEDGQRAMRLIRSMANKYGIDAERVGIMGFSAGGHLAAMIETEPNKQWYVPIDEVDRLSAKPNFAALLYPVITMLPPYDHTHSEKEICGNHAGTDVQIKYSSQLHVKKSTPPTFLAQAVDDPISNIANSKMMYAALLEKNITSYLKVFSSGGHGWGMGSPQSPVHEWPELFKKWAQSNDIWR